MSSQVLLQRQSHEKNAQLRPQSQLQLLLRQFQLLSQLRSPLLHLLKFRRLRQLHHQLLLHNLLQLQPRQLRNLHQRLHLQLRRLNPSQLRL